VPAQSSPHRTLVQTWVDHGLAAQLRERAISADRSVAAETRVALRQYLESSEAALAGGSATRMAVRDDAHSS
jgi:plasmid stability protein